MLITKKLLSTKPRITQDLSISNAVTTRSLVTYLTERGDYTPAQALCHRGEHLHVLTHIRWSTMTPGISNPAEIAEVYRFGPDPETSQHDNVQWWWWPRSYAALRGAALEKREKEGRRSAHQGERERRHMAFSCCVFSSPLGPPLYSGEGCTLFPSTKAPGVAKGRARAAAAKGGGARPAGPTNPYPSRPRPRSQARDAPPALIQYGRRLGLMGSPLGGAIKVGCTFLSIK
jgi:hypothetical protein